MVNWQLLNKKYISEKENIPKIYLNGYSKSASCSVVEGFFCICLVVDKILASLSLKMGDI